MEHSSLSYWGGGNAPWYTDEDDNLILLDSLFDVEFKDFKFTKADVSPATYVTPLVLKRVQHVDVLGVNGIALDD